MNSHRTPEQSAALARVLGDASTVARQQRNLTRAERFAALREAGHGYAAPEYKIGDRVTFRRPRSSRTTTREAASSR